MINLDRNLGHPLFCVKVRFYFRTVDMQVGPRIHVGIQLARAEVCPTSGPAWCISHFRSRRRRCPHPRCGRGRCCARWRPSAWRAICPPRMLSGARSGTDPGRIRSSRFSSRIIRYSGFVHGLYGEYFLTPRNSFWGGESQGRPSASRARCRPTPCWFRRKGAACLAAGGAVIFARRCIFQ